MRVSGSAIQSSITNGVQGRDDNRLQQQAVEHSGTWEPESADAKRSEEEMIADYYRELVEEHGDEGEQAEAQREAARGSKNHQILIKIL
mgnify:CR=1 FL=1